MGRFRVGIVGCGSIAQAAAWCFRLDGKTKLSFCCDREPARLSRFAKTFSIPGQTTNYEELLNSPEVDIVYLSLPHYLHYEVVAEAIKANKPVLCEKPIAISVSDAVQMVALSEGSGVKVGVNYQYRYDQAVLQLKRAADSGQLGKIRYVRINVPWHRGDSYLQGWHQSQSMSGGGTLLTMGSHAIDFTQWIIGSKPINALGKTTHSKFQVEVEDLAMGIIEFENGTLVEVCSSMVAQPERGIEVQFYTDRGTATYTNTPFPIVTFTRELLAPVPFPVGGFFAFQRSLRAFVRWVAGEMDYLIPAREALAALACVTAIYQSAINGQNQLIEI